VVTVATLARAVGRAGLCGAILSDFRRWVLGVAARDDPEAPPRTCSLAGPTGPAYVRRR
jgi:hypothetical protein